VPPKVKKTAPKVKKQTAMTVAAPAAILPAHEDDTTSLATAAALFGPTVELKKGETIPDRKSQILTLMNSVNGQYKGRAVLRQGSEITNVFMLRRPTSVTSLDIALGGGLPAGGLTQIIGKYSAGKSYLANRIMATAQQNYGEDFAASVNMTEMRFDKHFAKWQCGVRIALSEDEIAVLRKIQIDRGLPDYTPEQVDWLRDQVGTFVEGVAGTAEQILEVVVQQVESNLFQVVLVDSFGALLTAAEAEADEGLEQKHRGGAAMVVTQFMHRLHAALNLPDKYGRPNTTTVIGINQYRDNVNAGLYGNPMKVAGGHALAHGKLVDLHIEQGSKIRVAVSRTENKIVGKEINWEILKGKAGCHDGPKGTYKFYFGESNFPFGIDLYSDLFSAGIQTGVVEQSGAWFSYAGEKLGQGMENAALKLYNDPGLLQKIRKDIFKVAGLNFIVREGV
jgi:recombination protein RecA